MATRKPKTDAPADEAPKDDQEQAQDAPAAEDEAQALQTPPETVQEPEGKSKDVQTKSATFSEAAKAATPSDTGFIGYSPERERTGMDDKGLSLARKSIVENKGPVPDPRRGVDDSDALKG